MKTFEQLISQQNSKDRLRSAQFYRGLAPKSVWLPVFHQTRRTNRAWLRQTSDPRRPGGLFFAPRALLRCRCEAG